MTPSYMTSSEIYMHKFIFQQNTSNKKGAVKNPYSAEFQIMYCLLSTYKSSWNTVPQSCFLTDYNLAIFKFNVFVEPAS